VDTLTDYCLSLCLSWSPLTCPLDNISDTPTNCLMDSTSGPQKRLGCLKYHVVWRYADGSEVHMSSMAINVSLATACSCSDYSRNCCCQFFQSTVSLLMLIAYSISAIRCLFRLHMVNKNYYVLHCHCCELGK
jgi:FlaA1/EpsC-like NDP-sugar epimerase